MKNHRLIFNLPYDITTIEVISEILKNNGLEESSKEYFDKSIKGIEPRKKVIKGAVVVLFEKKIPEEKLAEFLAKHLECPKETAKKIIADIKEKLIPYAKIIEIKSEEEIAKEREERRKKEREAGPSVEELLIEKIKGEIPEDKVEENPQTSAETIKKVEIEDVEENAEKLKKQREETARPGTAGGELQRKGQTDKYREPTD